MITIKKNGAVNYHAERRFYVAPAIKESFIDDNGNIQHVLNNGNTVSEINYTNMWGKIKGKINLKSKGKSPDSRTNWIKG